DALARAQLAYSLYRSQKDNDSLENPDINEVKSQYILDKSHEKKRSKKLNEIPSIVVSSDELKRKCWLERIDKIRSVISVQSEESNPGENISEPFTEVKVID
ncbi:MAG: hypothetical protein MHPSP_001210, partial [Paramarteilia canceri]